MGEITTLALMRYNEVKNRLRLILHQPLLKVALLISFSAAFWFGLYILFYYGIKFINGFPLGKEDLIPAIFYIFFFALTLMLILSNGIISYISFFKSKETEFLLSSPIKVENIFLYKLIESLVFSSWAILFLATPLIAAYGSFYKLGWQFYIFSIIFFVIFILLPAIFGSIITLFLAVFSPRSKKALIIFICVIVIVVCILIVSKVLAISGPFKVEYRLVKEVLDEVSFSRNPILPSYWIAKGILLLSYPDYNAFLFLLLVISNVLFCGVIVYILAGKLMLKGWFFSQGLRRVKKRIGEALLYKLSNKFVFFADKKIKSIIIKDMKGFFRDPAQWLQFLIFFGLLGLYFLNLRTFSYEEKQIHWKNLVAQMNLFATVLTLATFTSRFVFPQLSLEGRRFWIIGMAPMGRGKILIGKLWLAILSTVLIGEVLICVSDYMLKIPLILIILHIVTILGICIGLSGLSVGLGALYPNLREDNPSKIISGFGGTLNLVLSLGFVILIIGLQFIPCYYHFNRFRITEDVFAQYIILSIIGIITISVIVCAIPMLVGIRAIKRMEV